MSDELEKNPWLTIWTKPKLTIRSIINTNPKRSLWWLGTLYVLQLLLYIANYFSVGLDYHYAIILILAIVLSPVIGIIWVYFSGWILHFTGRWLKGKAPIEHSRAVYAWSIVPYLLNLGMWFILLVFSANYVFIQFSSGPSLFFTNIISMISNVWSLVILIQCVREVQGFSVGRAIANWALFTLISVPIFVALLYGVSFFFEAV